MSALFEYIMPVKDRLKGIPKSQEKAGIKTNNPGHNDTLPVDHWAFGVLDWHTQNNHTQYKQSNGVFVEVKLGGKMMVRSHLLSLSFLKMDSLNMSSPVINIRVNGYEIGEFLSSKKEQVHN